MVVDIRFEHVDAIYQPGTPFEHQALFDINVTIKEGSYTAIIGHTGSGKSTFLQHLDALLKPTRGKVFIGDREITPETNNKNLKPIRKKVGIVFQFPESQLFEETVAKDIAFGPKNFGATESEAEALAKRMLKLVGMDESYLERSPFDLSGGQMRRVAIAGVLAMEPEVLVLDEPTAGLDPQGRREMMEMFARLHRDQKITVVLVTHQMEDVADFADRVIVLEDGRLVKEGTPREIFSDVAWLRKKQLGMPQTRAFAEELIQKGFTFSPLPLTPDELADQLAHRLKRGADAGER